MRDEGSRRCSTSASGGCSRRAAASARASMSSAATFRRLGRSLATSCCESIDAGLENREEATAYALGFARDLEHDDGGALRRHVRQRADVRLRRRGSQGRRGAAAPCGVAAGVRAPVRSTSCREPGRRPRGGATPVGRYGGALAERPSRRSRGDRDRRGRRRAGVPRRARSRTSTSVPRTRPARTTATSPAWPRCSPGCPSQRRGGDREPALRVGPRGGRVGVPRGRGRRRRAVRRRRCRVDEPGAARDGEAGARLSARQSTVVGHDARLALPEPAAGGDVPARVDGRDRRERRRTLERVARGAGRVRAPLAAALGRRRRGGRFDDELVAVDGRRARRASAPGHERGEARGAEARVSLERRHRDRGELQRHQRRRRRARDRERGEGAASSASSRSARSSAARSPASTRA